MKHLFFLFFALYAFSSNAQFANFWNTRTQKNPAFQVLNHQHFANVTHGNMLPSLSGSRRSNSLSYGTFLKRISGGLGFYYNNFSWGRAYKSNAIKVAYNYQKQLGRRTRLSIGTGVGAVLSNIDYDKLTFGPGFVLPSSGNSFGLDFGLALQWRKLEVGTGVQNLLELDDVSRSLNGQRWINFMAQYAFGKETGIQFFPQALIETDLNWNRVSLNGKVGYKNKYFLGSGLTFNDRAMFTAEVFIYQKIRLTYSYLHTISALSSYSGSGHEFGLCLEIKRKTPTRRTSGGVSF